MTNFEAAGNELRARWSCDQLAEQLGLDAVPAYDKHGHATGWVAVNPAALHPGALADALSAFYERDQE